MKRSKLKLLLLDDDSNKRCELRYELEESLSVEISEVSDIESAEELLMRPGTGFDIIVADRRTGGGDFVDWAEDNKHLLERKGVVIYTGLMPDYAAWKQPRFRIVELRSHRDSERIVMAIKSEIERLMELGYLHGS